MDGGVPVGGGAGCSHSDEANDFNGVREGVPVGGSAICSYSDESKVYIGVRDRRLVEKKDWFETVNFSKEVKGSREVAACVYDLARLYESPQSTKVLNVDTVVDSIRKKLDPRGIAIPTSYSAKEFMEKYVRENPLSHDRDKWSTKAKKVMDAVKDEIVKRGFSFFDVWEAELMAMVDRAYFQEGCRKEDLVKEDVVQMLRVKVEELEAAVKTKDAVLGASNALIAFLKAKVEELEAEVKTKDAILGARNALIAFFNQENKAVYREINLKSFQDPFEENDDRMEETELDNDGRMEETECDKWLNEDNLAGGNSNDSSSHDLPEHVDRAYKKARYRKEDLDEVLHAVQEDEVQMLRAQAGPNGDINRKVVGTADAASPARDPLCHTSPAHLQSCGAAHGHPLPAHPPHHPHHDGSCDEPYYQLVDDQQPQYPSHQGVRETEHDWDTLMTEDTVLDVERLRDLDHPPTPDDLLTMFS